MTKRKIEVPAGRGKAWWQRLSPEQKKAVVFPRLVLGDSNKAIGEDLGISPNSIAGKRNNWNEAGNPDSLEPVWVDELASKTEPSAPPVPKPARVDRPKKVTPVRVVSTKLTTDWRRQCVHTDGEGHQCGYEHLPDETSCGRPGHEK